MTDGVQSKMIKNIKKYFTISDQDLEYVFAVDVTVYVYCVSRCTVQYSTVQYSNHRIIDDRMEKYCSIFVFISK